MGLTTACSYDVCGCCYDIRPAHVCQGRVCSCRSSCTSVASALNIAEATSNNFEVERPCLKLKQAPQRFASKLPSHGTCKTGPEEVVPWLFSPSQYVRAWDASYPGFYRLGQATKCFGSVRAEHLKRQNQLTPSPFNTQLPVRGLMTGPRYYCHGHCRLGNGLDFDSCVLTLDHRPRQI